MYTESIVCEPVLWIGGGSPPATRSIQRRSTLVYAPWMSIRVPYTSK
jgi:hypothetical protein